MKPPIKWQKASWARETPWFRDGTYWKISKKMKQPTSNQQRRSMAHRSCPKIGYSEADPKASCATCQAPINLAFAACTYSNDILNLLSSNKSPSNLWRVWCLHIFLSPVALAPAEVLGLALSLALAAPWWHRLVKSRIASFSADSTALARAWGSSRHPKEYMVSVPEKYGATPQKKSNLYRKMLINQHRILSSQCRAESAECRMDSIRHWWNRGFVASLFKCWIISRDALSKLSNHDSSLYWSSIFTCHTGTCCNALAGTWAARQILKQQETSNQDQICRSQSGCRT